MPDPAVTEATTEPRTSSAQVDGKALLSSPVAVPTLHCTRKLLPRLASTAFPTPAPSTAPAANDSVPPARLAPWTANLLSRDRKPIVLVTSHVTLLPVLVQLAPAATFLARLPEAIGDLLLALGIPLRTVTSELEAMQSWTLAKTNERRVLGTMNDFALMLSHYPDALSLRDAALQLARSPCSVIGMDSPDDATRRLLAPPA